MKPKILFNLMILPILAVVFFDQALKFHAIQTSQVFYNSGLMFGSFTDAPPLARIVCIITFFIFFMVGGVLLQLFFIEKNKLITVSLGIYLGGVSSNALDRLIKGAVPDHIILPGLPHLAWNAADLIQWIGLSLFLILIWKNHKTLWADPSNLRKSLLIDWHFQKKFILVLMSMTLFIWGVLTVFSYSYFRYVMEIVNPNAFFITSTCLLLLFELGAIIFSLWWSHKIAGPLYAFEKYVDSLNNEDHQISSSLKLRRGDEIKNLEKVAKKIQALIK